MFTGECHPRTTKVIKLSCLSTVKAMDYIEGTRVNCVAQLRSDKPKTETIKRHPKRWGKCTKIWEKGWNMRFETRGFLYFSIPIIGVH